jgi:hypothetical protein
MAGERVDIVGPYGERGTVPASQVAAVTKAGGRLATPEELAADKLDAEYAAKSTAEKVGGFAAIAAPYPIQQALRASGKAALPPTLEAYREGAGAGFTAGLEGAATHEALKAVGGKAAADAYTKQRDELKRAHDGAYSLGEAAGFAGSMVAAPAAGVAKGAGLMRALPGVAIGEAGLAAERLAARGVAGLATKGALGRAAATATTMAARAGVESALYSAAHEVSEEMLGDKPLSAEKILIAGGTGLGIGALGGAVLGGGGSLLASGAKAGLSRVMSRAAEAEGGAVAQLAGRSSVNNTMRTMAQEQATKSLTIGGKISNRFGRLVEKAGGEAAMGETLLRHEVVGVVDREAGLLRNMFDAAKGGTPADMVPKLKGAIEKVGGEIGELTKASPARVSVEAVDAELAKRVAEYSDKAGSEAVTNGIQKYRESLANAMLGKSDDALTISVQDALKMRRDLDELVYRETKTLDPNARVQALRDFRTDFAGKIETAIDEASGQAVGEVKAQLRALNKDYQRLKVAAEIAEDSAARAAQNRTISPTDMMAAGSALATGNLLAAPVAAVGHKMLRERGNAAVAVLLQRMADMGTLTRAVSSVDDLVGKAAKGAISPVAIARAAVPKSTAIARAERVAEQVREHQRDPYRTAAKIDERVADVRRVAPQTAEHLSAAMTRSMAYLASKVPPQQTRGQLEPRPPRMPEHEARLLLRASEYASDPKTILRDISAGKVDRETVDAAKAIMPEVFAELQRRTLENIVGAQTKGKPIPYKQRIKLSTLLDIPGDWTVAPEALAMLQSNASAGPEPGENEAPAKPSGRAVEINSPQSTLDRIESR